MQNAEPSRKTAKFKPKILSKRSRLKDKDEFDWRSDSAKQMAAPSCLEGYKSIKHKWLTKYMTAQERSHSLPAWDRQDNAGLFDLNGQASLDPRASSLTHLPHTASLANADSLQNFNSRNGSSGAGGMEPDLQNHLSTVPRWGSPDNLQPQDRQPSRSKEDWAAEAAAKTIRKQVEREIKATHEKAAKRQTDAGLEHDRVEAAARQAQREAEQELRAAAEQDRGAIADKSLLRETNHRAEPDQSSLVPQSDAQPKRALPKLGRVTPVRKPLNRAESTAKQKKVSPLQPGSASKKRSRESPQKDRAADKAAEGRRSGKSEKGKVSSQIKETVAETEGKSRKAEPADQWEHSQGKKVQQVNGHNSGGTAPDSHPLLHVGYIDGHDKEHLGELDLHQLDSFRDLWLTIRSAFSARLPKTGLMLLYQDVDNDLMLHRNEPWDYFKSVATSLILAKNLSMA